MIVSPGRVDRSPCGTATSARLAVLHAQGLPHRSRRALVRQLQWWAQRSGRSPPTPLRVLTDDLPPIIP
ncbi:proline racemase family protein [Mycobacterium sp. OAS707]